MFLLNNKQLPIDVPFEHNGIQYPANWLRLTTIEEKNAIGIVEVDDIKEVDGRFYFPDGSPKDLQELKEDNKKSFKLTANNLLSISDWYIIRKYDRGIEVPEDIIRQREDILQECDRLIDAVDSAKTMEEFIDAINNQQWPLI